MEWDVLQGEHVPADGCILEDGSTKSFVLCRFEANTLHEECLIRDELHALMRHKFIKNRLRRAS